MRIRIRYTLPSIQVAIAAALTASNRLRQIPMGGSAWAAPDRQFCDGLNAPAALIRYCLLSMADRLFPGIFRFEFAVETAVYLPLVGLLWYVVGVEIAGQRGRNRPLRSRHAVDICAMMFGAALALVALLIRHQFGRPVSSYANLVAVPYFVWAVIIVVFYAHDLVASHGGRWLHKTSVQGKRG